MELQGGELANELRTGNTKCAKNFGAGFAGLRCHAWDIALALPGPAGRASATPTARLIAKSYGRVLAAEPGCRFERVGELEYAEFVAIAADDLDTDRQAFGCEATWH